MRGLREPSITYGLVKKIHQLVYAEVHVFKIQDCNMIFLLLEQVIELEIPTIRKGT